MVISGSITTNCLRPRSWHYGSWPAWCDHRRPSPSSSSHYHKRRIQSYRRTIWRAWMDDAPKSTWQAAFVAAAAATGGYLPGASLFMLPRKSRWKVSTSTAATMLADATTATIVHLLQPSSNDTFPPGRAVTFPSPLPGRPPAPVIDSQTPIR